MEDKMLYKDPSQPVDVRVEDLLSRMTLEEKAAQLCGDLAASFIVDGKLSHEALKEKFKDGHGRITQYSLVGLVSPKQIAEITNELQDFFVNETRLGIPVALQSENLCGYPGAGGTLFPAQINVGSTWEPELAEEMSSIIGQESRAVGITSAMSPVIDVSRDPRWGRITETYGEDAALTSAMASAFVKGIQGDELKEGVLATAKHFAGHGITEGGLGREATDKELSGGVMCDGLGSSLAAVFGVLPNTSFSQNVGLVAMNKVVNRFSIATGGIFLIACGLFPKLAALISIMPQSVLGGAAVMMFSSIVVSGIQLITKWPVTPRNVTIVSVALGLGYGLGANSAVLAHMPQAITLIFGGSGIVPAALFAIILNIVLPPDEKSEVEIAEEILDMKKKEAQKK